MNYLKPALVWLLALYSPLLQGQVSALTLTHTISLPGINCISIDRQGRYVVSTDKGSITRLDSNGKKELLYSPTRPASVTLIEAWNGLRIFIFYRDLQEYSYLDRFLTDEPNSKIPFDVIGFARLAAPAADGSLWVLDDTDLTLKKLNPANGAVVQSTQLSLQPGLQKPDITYLREYQNQLFAADNNAGLLVFDNMGNLKRIIPVPGLNFFSFSGESLVYCNASSIHRLNLYNASDNLLPLPTDCAARYALCNGSQAAVFTNTGIYFFRLP